MMINQNTRLYGVVGYPLGHSLSSVLHNAAFSARGLNALYLSFESQDIAGCVKGARSLGINGLSITMPYKSKVMGLLDEVDELAGKIGAVNTIVNHGGRLKGYNTDATGALRALEQRMALPGKHCIMIGAGGAARAIGFILKERGVALTLVNRSIERGEALARLLGCSFVPLKESVGLQGDLLIQTTPAGMSPNEEACVVAPALLHEGMTVMDIVYNPVDTKLLRTARARHCRTINGLRMFVYQGAEQFRLWTGGDPPLSAMTAAVGSFLRRRS